jgi:hypothetical protein
MAVQEGKVRIPLTKLCPEPPSPKISLAYIDVVKEHHATVAELG